MAKTATKKSKAMVPKEDAALVKLDYGDDAGKGVEDLGTEHYLVPFLMLLQSNSPQCKGEDSEARPGMLYNTVSEEAVSGKTGSMYTLAAVNRVFVEWRSRESGGGFIARHDPNSELVRHAVASSEKFGQNKTTGGNDPVADTERFHP